MARTIRFLFEYGHPWPLWESFNGKITMEPDDYQLSPELIELLRLSYQLWADHFHHEHGWDSAEAKRRWVEESQQALSVLTREVADIAEVIDARHF
jgi:hypothetical protein